MQGPVTLGERDYFLMEHPELGASVYDRRPDGSGICYSSRLRPVVTMRPDVVTWSTGHPRHFSGDLLLIDSGCELDGYAADLTRTFPVNGRFSPPQREIYELVLAAQAAAISAVKPGEPWDAPHRAAITVLTQGLVELKLIKETVEQAIEKESYRRFYMHRTGHWLGLDVHDAGDYKRGGEWRALAPGMVLTVEPGCYIRGGEGVPDRFADIGVRIEDDVLVTESGAEVLTRDAPKSVRDVEALVGSGNG